MTENDVLRVYKLLGILPDAKPVTSFDFKATLWGWNYYRQLLDKETEIQVIKLTHD